MRDGGCWPSSRLISRAIAWPRGQARSGFGRMSGFGFGWGREARALLGISCAVSATMFAQLAMDAVETAVAARLGAVPLAGMALAGGFYGVVFLFALGVVTAVTPLAAHAAGQGDRAALRRIGQNGVWMALAVSLPLAAALTAGAWLLPARAPEWAAARAYLLGAGWGMPGWVVYVAIRCFAVATGRIRIATALMVAALPVQAALAVALAFPAGLGIAGVGLAYALSGYAALLLLAILLAVSAQDAFGAALRPPFAIDRAACTAILRLGLPFAVRIVLREAVLPVAALGLAPFGAPALAAHAVAARAVQLAGVFAFGFSDAASTRVSHALGAGAADRARGVGWLAVGLAVLAGLAAASACCCSRPGLVATVLLGTRDGAALRQAVALLPVAALLLLLEGVLAAASGALAGMRDARGPLAIALLGGWGVGLPLGMLLAASAAMPATGLWTGLAVGWGLATALTLVRLARRRSPCGV